jgi:hypothetical protein
LNNVGNKVADSLCKLGLLEANYKFITEIKIDASLTWEYMVYWRGMLIKESAREFMKKINYLRYKAEWLTLDINRSFCLNIRDISIDWVRSLKVIMSEFNSDILELNNDKMAYNLKNYLEILLTMVLLNRRNSEIYNNSRCCRCKFMIETWTHVWICKENDMTITQIINEAFEILKIKLDNLKFKIKSNHHAKLLYIMNEHSLVIFNRCIFHEAIKGIVNEWLYLGIDDIAFKDAIQGFVANIKELSRMYIWLPRCKEVSSWERSQGISQKMKRLGTSSCSFIGINENAKQRFVQDTLNRWFGTLLENLDNIQAVWQKTDLQDLWTYYNLVSFRSSTYASQFSVLD